MKPILFNTQMVNAILDGNKVCTRRIIKGLEEYEENNGVIQATFKTEKAISYFGGNNEQLVKEFSKILPSDVLYVRETWTPFDNNLCTCYECYGCKAQREGYIFKAGNDCEDIKWKPSIHMPKDAARIFLKVEDVRVEKLQDITQDEVKREGVKPRFDMKDKFSKDIAIQQFRELWDSTVNKKDIEEYGFDANPFVWVIVFERISKREAYSQFK